MKVSVSFLSGKDNLKTRIKKIDETNADYFHVDLMDNTYTKEIAFSYSDVVKHLSLVSKPLDVHLMVKNPAKYIEKFAVLNTEYITFQIEDTKEPLKLIEEIKNYGILTGIAIKPKTDISVIEKYLSRVDLVLVMTVEPGEGGQSLMLETISKIGELKKLKEENNYDYVIEADGGIKDINIAELKQQGLEMAVVGTFVCNSNSYQASIDTIRNAE